MLSEDLRNYHGALGMLLGHVDPDRADIVRLIRRNLEASIDDAVTYETRLLVPGGDALCKADRPPLPGELSRRSV